MKKFLLSALSLLVVTTGFAEDIILMNKTAYPAKNQPSKIAVQWAGSAKEVQDHNQASLTNTSLNPTTLQELGKSGKIKLNVPGNAEYFRVLVWSEGKGEPDLLTNWVDIVPNKTYTLKSDYLVPAVLMPGAGC